MKIVYVIGAALLAASAMPAGAATAVVANGKLTGATGINVDGGNYDVEFVDGTCAEVFAGCVTSNFAFQNQQAATDAAQALLDQVFLDGPLGNFDTDPSLTRGCSNATGCFASVPYADRGSDAMADNFAVESSDRVVGTGMFNRLNDFSFASALTWARFTAAAPVIAPVVAPVPEPATWGMMLLGFGAMGFAMRRRSEVRTNVSFA